VQKNELAETGPQPFTHQVTSVERAAFIREQLPSEGLFADKEWRISPYAFPLSSTHLTLLEKLGPLLLKFTQACNLLYRQSVRGKQPAWIAELLDRGKPPEMIALSRSEMMAQEIPRILRPDLILTETGFGLSEIDSLPGGIGLTAWLNTTYAALGEPVLGGARGMHDGFASVFPEGDLIFAKEGADYAPEFTYLLGTDRVHPAETYLPKGRPLYRFVEAFDWLQIPSLASLPMDATMTPPLKPYLEEKLWLALFWSQPLQPFWRRKLSDKGIHFLQQIIPYSWVLDPTPLPPHAVLPELGVQDFRDVGHFSQKDRELILKISGFSPTAWGARGVFMGSDLSAPEWQERLAEALAAFPEHPSILQRFVKGGLFTQPFVTPEGEERPLQGRARVCPYYFVTAERRVQLGGVLVTLCPADKKLLHGMREAILSPAKLAPSAPSAP
jgi:hypothetical protein